MNQLIEFQSFSLPSFTNQSVSVSSSTSSSSSSSSSTNSSNKLMPNIILATTGGSIMSSFDNYSSSPIFTSLNTSNNQQPLINISMINQQQQQQQQLQQQQQGCTYLNDANKAFDDVVFDILKVDPDDIAGQLTLIDLPLFKAIEPDELISCKWMSRDKLIKAPNIVQFTRRFNQTTFWCQKEILNCKRIETRAKMLTHFIKICKRLNELHSFNSLMAIVVALKSAPIYRLKKTWSHISKRDMSTFERLADLMFDTNDNKRKLRDMHMNCKLPCIPFLGLFLTDLIHIDIAHPHNSFDNPQRRNQMNNICRLISEYQQSNYQDLTSISCSCEFESKSNDQLDHLDNNHVTSLSICNPNKDSLSSDDTSLNNNHNNNNNNNSLNNLNTGAMLCMITNCSCALHHNSANSSYAGGGLINSDGTIYINEIKYVKNYLNSFLYIEELQKFKEDENYRDSLELEPDPDSTFISNNNNHTTNNLNAQQHLTTTNNSNNNYTSPLPVTCNNSIHFSTSSPSKLVFQLDQIQNNNLNHRKTLSIATSLFNNNNQNDSKDKDLFSLNDLKPKHHPLDDSIVEQTPVNLIIPQTHQQPNRHHPQLSHHSSITNSSNHLISNDLNLLNEITYLNLNLTKEEQKKLLNSVKLNDPPSLLKELLKHRLHQSYHQQQQQQQQQQAKQPSIKNKFNCYSSSTADLDEDEDDNYLEDSSNHDTNNLESLDNHQIKSTPSSSNQNRTLVSRSNSPSSNSSSNSNQNQNRQPLSGRNLFKTLSDENSSFDQLDSSELTSSVSPGNILSQLFIQQQTQQLIQFESPIKRKCIIKNYRKPRFSQWKSYWLQLVGGNLLIYYPAKTSIMFSSRVGSSNSTASAGDLSRRSSSNSTNDTNMLSTSTNMNEPIDECDSTNHIPSNTHTEQLKNQLQSRKVYYHKNPCKMHPIANWMVVNLFQDRENELLAALAAQNQSTNQTINNTQSSNDSNTLSGFNKFDIQLNDLNNGNMYKYRFDSLDLAKEWLEQFKLASTYHERQKPDNLIRFD